MPNNRARGRRGELQAAERFGGKRISVTGLPGSDIEIGGREFEVKLVKTLPALLRNWLAQVKRQESEAVLFKENLGQWFIILEADRFFGSYVHIDDALEIVRKPQKSDAPSL